MRQFLLVCLGGAVGTGARYLLGGWLPRVLGPAFPWATLSVNLLGSLLLALVMHLSLQGNLMSPTARMVVATGVLGGFTTYSSFNYETLRLFEQGTPLVAMLNVVGTLLGCLAAGMAGLALGRWWLGH